MIVLVAKISVRLPHAHSLKEKRKVAKSLSAKLSQRFSASVREIEAQDLQQKLVLGLAYTALSESEAQNTIYSMEETIWALIESEGELLSFDVDLFSPDLCIDGGFHIRRL